MIEAVARSTRHRVALVNPPSAPGTVANREGAAGMGTLYHGSKAFLYPPHTLATFAANLRNAGHEVRAFDAVVQGLPPDVGNADVMGVFVSYAGLNTDLAFIEAVRKQSSARLMAFGPAMRFVGEQVLAMSPVDAVLVGEAESFGVAAVRHLCAQNGSRGPQLLSPADVGATGCDAQGFVQDLDALPFPAWDLLPYKKYSLLTVLSSRGCPELCAYCPYAAAQGHRFRARSIESVLAELAWLSKRFDLPRLVFRDPVFAYARERVVAICEGILQRGLRLRWECESRPEHFDVGLLQLMQRAGCQWVKIGLESADEALLQSLGRVGSAQEAAAYLQRVVEVVSTCAKIGLNCRLFVMAGLPGQDVASTQRTARFLEKLRPAALNIKAFEAYPGLDLPPLPVSDCAAQMEVLQQAQANLEQSQPVPGPLTRGKRWIKAFLRGERHG